VSWENRRPADESASRLYSLWVSKICPRAREAHLKSRLINMAKQVELKVKERPPEAVQHGIRIETGRDYVHDTPTTIDVILDKVIK
jgi:hypothetical protein